MDHEEMGNTLRYMCAKMIELLGNIRDEGIITEDEYVRQTALKKRFIEDFDSRKRITL